MKHAFTMTNEAATNHHQLNGVPLHLNNSRQQQQQQHPQQQIEPNHQHHQHNHQQPQHLQQHQQQHQQVMSHHHQNQHHHHTGGQTAGPSARHHQQLGGANISGIGHQQSGSLKKDLPANGKKTKGRVRIKMEYIHNKLRRYTTFSKRKTGIMKKAFELATLTGTQVMLLVASETGHVYTFATKKLGPVIISDAGKALIQTCLNSPDSDNLLVSATNSVTSASNTNQANGALAIQQANSPSSSTPRSSTPGSSSSPAIVSGTAANQQSGAHQPHTTGSSATNSTNSNNSQASGKPATGGTGQQQHSSQQQQEAPSNSPNMKIQYQGTQAQPTIASSANSNGASNVASQMCPIASIQSQHNMMLATSSNNINGNGNSTLTNGTNASNSTTDQRMSVTGFEETELSYSINDDLNERAFNNCLPISIGTIAGNGMNGSGTASASIITSPQAFEQTLQSQEAETSVVDSCQVQNGTSHEQQNRRQLNEHHNQQQRQQTTKNTLTNRNNANRTNINSFNNKNSLIEQQTSIQLLQNASSMQQSQPQFNYNPLYTGVHNNFSTNGKSNESVPEDDKNIDDLSNTINGADDLMNDEEGDEDEDVLNDIYHYSDSTTENSCNNSKHHCHSLDTAFGLHHPQRESSDRDGEEDGGDSNTQYCSDSGPYIQPSNLSSSASNRKQEMPFGNPHRTNVRLLNSPTANSPSCRTQQQQQQQQSFQQSIGANQNYGEGISSSQGMMGLVCSGVQSRQRNRKYEQQDNQVGRKRLSNHAIPSTNFNHNQAQHTNYQQQQFTLTNIQAGQQTGHTAQMDLSEECNGLFVEYQTNRNPLVGLEELNNLNVTNCDSETLEEHINMLSNEDCFTTNDDLQDFGIGSTNDHFLNMLFMNSNQSVNGNTSSQPHLNNQSLGLHVEGGNHQLNNQISMVPFNQMELNSTNSRLSCDEKQSSINEASTLTNGSSQQQQQVEKKATKMKRISSGKNKSSITTNEHTTTDQRIKDSKKKQSATRVVRKIQNCQQETNQIYESADIKIRTTNTNKRLLPKKNANQTNNNNNSSIRQVQNQIKPTDISKKLSNNCATNGSWMASPSSTSNTSNSSAMSPNSTSQFEYEAPYRQQLENLRKKLKMDVVPLVPCITTAAATITATQLPMTVVNLTEQNKSTTNVNDVSAPALAKDVNSIGSYQMSKVTNATSTITTSTSTSNSIFVGQGPSQPNGCAPTNAYVLARTNDSHHGFETSGTIYLRTSNGLVPISNHSSDRRSCVVSFNTNETNYSSSSMPTTSAALMINCVAGGAQYPGSTMANQGPTNVIFQATPSDDQLSKANTIKDRIETTQILISSGESGDSTKDKNILLTDPTDNQNLFNGPVLQNSDHMEHSTLSNGQQVALSNLETVHYVDNQAGALVGATIQYPVGISISQQQQQ